MVQNPLGGINVQYPVNYDIYMFWTSHLPEMSPSAGSEWTRHTGHLIVWEEWTDCVLTGFIRVIVIGFLLIVSWGRLLSNIRSIRSTVGSGLPPVLPYCRRQSLLRRNYARGVNSSISCHWTYNHNQSAETPNYNQWAWSIKSGT